MTVRTVGQYALQERLGAGGMGEVWRASHVLLGRQAAVKLIDPSAGGSDRHVLLDRLMREARATSMLVSPHTVGLYDFGVADDDSFYAVMELLDGIDLRTLVEEHGPQPPARVASLLAQACESLAEAHECGLVHRDIKPANLFVCRHGRRVDVVKVLDFGLVKAVEDPELLPGPRLTASHTFVGSPAFMAPEMLGAGHPIDGRTDLYALGCVAVYLLTGRLVYDHEHAIDMMLAHRAEPVPDLGELGVPAPFHALVRRCLQKDPVDRYDTADALRQAVDALDLDDSWGDEEARAWWDHHHEPRFAREPTPSGTTGRRGTETMPLEDLRTSEVERRLADVDAREAELRGEASSETMAGALLPDPSIPPPDGRGPAWMQDPGVGEHGGVTTAKAIGWAIAGASFVLVAVALGLGLTRGMGAAPSAPDIAPTALTADAATTPRDDADVDPLAADARDAADTAGEGDPENVTKADAVSTLGATDAEPVDTVDAPAPLSDPPPSDATTAAPPVAPRDEPGVDTDLPAAEPAALPGRCLVEGEVTAIALRAEDGSLHRCPSEVPPGRYAVYADFGDGMANADLPVEVAAEQRLVLACNQVNWTCERR